MLKNFYFRCIHKVLYENKQKTCHSSKMNQLNFFKLIFHSINPVEIDYKFELFLTTVYSS